MRRSTKDRKGGKSWRGAKYLVVHPDGGPSPVGLWPLSVVGKTPSLWGGVVVWACGLDCWDGRQAASRGRGLRGASKAHVVTLCW